MRKRRNDWANCVLMVPMSAITHARVRAAAAALLAAAAIVIAALGAQSADAAKITVLGSSAQTANPACPPSPCQAIGKVSGYQTTIGKMKSPFLVPYDGTIVAWSIKLSAPSAEQAKFFNEFYGGPPSARISVLKPVKQSKTSWKLRAQTPIEELETVLGGTSTFTLSTPLKVRTGQMIAISVPTWAPAFAIGLPEGNAWRASRAAGTCTNTDEIKKGTAQEQLGSERSYGCSYTTARLLYSATFVKGAQSAPKKKKKPAPGDSQNKPGTGTTGTGTTGTGTTPRPPS